MMNETEAAGVAHMLCVSINLDTFPAMYAKIANYPQVSVSVGVHPNELPEQYVSIDTLVQLAQSPKVVAIGETGLDYYRTNNDLLPKQQQQFRTQIQAARLCNKPLIIHSRQASKDTLQILQEENASEIGGVLHCFTEDWNTAQAALDMNFYISFSGIITFPNAANLREVATRIPLDRLLIETDSPYLAPVPHRGKPNEPKLVKYIAKCIAELRQISVETLITATGENFMRLFGTKLDLKKFTWLIFNLVTLIAVQPIQAGWFATQEQEASQFFARKHYEQAAQRFTDPYRKGVAQYKAGDFTAAAASFTQVTRSEVTQDARYNLGNARFQLGDLTGAIAAYEEVLQENSDHEDAAYNLALARSMLPSDAESEKQEQKTPEKKQSQTSSESSKQEQQKQEQKQQEDKQSSDSKQEQQEQKQTGDSKQEQQEQKQAGDSKQEQQNQQQSSGQQESKQQQSGDGQQKEQEQNQQSGTESQQNQAGNSKQEQQQDNQGASSQENTEQNEKSKNDQNQSSEEQGQATKPRQDVTEQGDQGDKEKLEQQAGDKKQEQKQQGQGEQIKDDTQQGAEPTDSSKQQGEDGNKNESDAKGAENKDQQDKVTGGEIQIDSEKIDQGKQEQQDQPGQSKQKPSLEQGESGKEQENSKSPQVGQQPVDKLDLPPDLPPEGQDAAAIPLNELDQAGKASDDSKSGEEGLAALSGSPAIGAGMAILEQMLEQVEGDPSYLMRNAFLLEEAKYKRSQGGMAWEVRPW
jgi:TatD family hydrolase